MTRLMFLGTTVALLSFLSSDAFGQGAIRGGFRGAAVGGLVGGKSGASTGAKVGVVTGATRSAIDRESQARTQYQSTAEYQNYQGANFNQSSPNVIMSEEVGTTTQAEPATPAKPAGESVISKDGKPIVGATFPADWKQQTGDNYVSAVSADGHCWSMFVTINSTSNKEAALKKVEDGLQNYMNNIKFDKESKTEKDAAVVTGTGEGKKAGTQLVFVAGVFDAGNGQLVAAGFAADAKLADQYKETVRGICETIKHTGDFQQ
ncbi:hypothetical protein GC197_12395 [bacterium]|nr:hypothetical protein [bacterium]